MRFTTLLSALFATLAGPALAAGYGDFTGNWVNQDPSTNNLSKVSVQLSGGGLRVEGWGSCHPSDCDWGQVPGVGYSETVGGDPAMDALEVVATFHSGFSESMLLLRGRPGDTLSYALYTRFTDSSGRRPYVARGTLRRGGYGGGGGGGGGYGEDCTSLDWHSAAVTNVGGQWMVVDGTHQLLAFGGDFLRANAGLQVIRHYRFTQHCFIGRPNPSMDYWKTGDTVSSAPTMIGADCIPNNPDTTRAQYVSGEWKLVDGSNWLVSFGSRESEARQAEDVVHHYRLNRQCFIGRPHAAMTYWLAR